jgi:hypothetical protein
MSGNFNRSARSLLYLQKQTLGGKPSTSAKGRKRKSVGLFDHLVGGDVERRRDREAKHFGGPHVDGEVEVRGALER